MSPGSRPLESTIPADCNLSIELLMENIISSFIFKLRNEFEIGLERIPAALFLSFIHFQIGNSDEASFVLPTVQYIKRCRLLKRRSNQTPFIVRLGDLESILTHCASILIETL